MNWKIGGVFIILFFVFTQGYSISNEDIRSIIDKDTATVEDAVLMIASIDNPDVGKGSIDVQDNWRLRPLKMDDPLNAGRLSIIAIEFKKVHAGILYTITGFSKYAAESLIYQKIFPPYFSWNRKISGKELIEFVSAIIDKMD